MHRNLGELFEGNDITFMINVFDERHTQPGKVQKEHEVHVLPVWRNQQLLPEEKFRTKENGVDR